MKNINVFWFGPISILTVEKELPDSFPVDVPPSRLKRGGEQFIGFMRILSLLST
jgi:hypothetical protein